MEMLEINIEEIKNQLDQLPLGISRFEFENFFLEAYPTPARQLAAVMIEIEKTYQEISQLKLKLANPHQYTNIPKQHMQDQREITVLTQKYNVLAKWYEKTNAQMRSTILKEYESQEEDYWANYLGRQAALELLSLGRVSKETMDKMSSLPVNAFEDTVRICTRYASLIKNTTQIVEDSMNSDATGLPTE